MQKISNFKFLLESELLLSPIVTKPDAKFHSLGVEDKFHLFIIPKGDLGGKGHVRPTHYFFMMVIFPFSASTSTQSPSRNRDVARATPTTAGILNSLLMTET